MIKPDFSYFYGGLPHGEVQKNPIKATVSKREFTEFHAVEWNVFYENTSAEDSKILSEIYDCDVLLALPEYTRPSPTLRITGEAPCIIWMQGCLEGEAYSFNDERSAQEFAFHTDYLFEIGMKKGYENHHGRSSDQMMHFFEITCKGKGYIAAIGWTGCWRAEFEREKAGIRMRAGLRCAEFYLKPMEKIRTATILIMSYDEKENRYNMFRDLIKTHYTPKITAKEHPGVLAALLWGSLPSDEMANRIRRLYSGGAKFEEYWIDAAWNGQSADSENTFDGTWADEIGNWEFKKDIHPDRLCNVSRTAQEAGAALMLWFDLEHASNITPIVKEHPEYFINNGEKFLLLNLGCEAAWTYAFNLLKNYFSMLKLRCYRQDFNIPPDLPWEFADRPGRRGITEIYHVLGLYKLFDALRGEFPDLIIDNCASGGRRLDIEMLKRSVTLYRSDYQCIQNPDPDVTNTHNTNISRYLPATGCSTKLKMDLYAARSTYSASWGYSGYATAACSMSEEEIQWLSEVIEEYVSIRKYFLGHFYNFGSDQFDSSAWVIWQYHDPSSDEGMVMAFRRKNSPSAEASVSLKELEGEYTFYNLDTKEHFTGGESLEIRLPREYSSAIIVYKKAGTSEIV